MVLHYRSTSTLLQEPLQVVSLHWDLVLEKMHLKLYLFTSIMELRYFLNEKRMILGI